MGNKLYIGLMSGTSGDGVTAALADIGPGSLQVVAYRTDPYAAAFRKRVLGALDLKAPQLAVLGVELAEAFAVTVKKLLKQAGVPASRVAAVGSHGQTVWHGPDGRVPATLQIGESAVLAERLGLPVVSDFRPRDLAAGGQGAPLVPYLDRYLFGAGPLRALQNLGGIGNVTLVGRGATTLAFDTGPANCLIDLAAERASGGRLTFDRDGRLARQGRVHVAAARRLLKDPYFLHRPPKSADRSYFGPAFLDRFKLQGADLVATATLFTALTVADQYRRFLPKGVKEVVVSGGGAKNPVLMAFLQTDLERPLRTTDELGLPGEAKEAACFALLAERTLAGKAGNVPAATGARGPRVLGKVTPA